MNLINGKKISGKILDRLEKEIKEKQLKLKLAVILVGDDPASKIYVKKKEEVCKRIGIGFELFELSAEIEKEELKKEIDSIIDDGKISGIVIQLPLPKKFDAQDILNLIPEEKNAESISPVVCAIGHILEEYKISLKGKKVVLIGKGLLVGIPVGKWLDKQNILFSGIENIKSADVIISGAGKPNLIKKDMVKQGVIIIDVGGDVDPEVSEKAGYITPLIGGIGPITVACLLENLIHGSTNI